MTATGESENGMHEPTPAISVIIVSYWSAAVLARALEALFAQDYPDFEAILVDNASGDETLAVARRFATRGLTIVANAVNRGYAGGNNQAVRMSRGDLLVLLNPDAILPPGALREVARAFADRPELGILGAKLVDADGRTVLHCGGHIDPAAHCSLHGRGEPDDGRWDEPREVDFVIGAAMALRRATWERLGGFDEDFNPCYYEDTDLCVRCRRLGLEVVCWPRWRVVHPEGHKSMPFATPGFWWYHHRHRLWFLCKHAGPWRLLTRIIPTELRWFASPQSAGLRRLMPRIYYYTARRWIARKVLRIPPPGGWKR